MNLRSRFGVLAAATAGVSAAVVAGVLFGLYSHGIGQRADADLVAAAGQANGIAVSFKQHAVESQGIPAFEKPLTLGDVTLEVLPDGVVLGGLTATGPVRDADVAIAERQMAPTLDTISYGGVAYRIYAMPMAGTDRGLVRATWPVSAGTVARQRLALLLGALVLAATFVAGLLGRLVAGRALAPISKLTRAAEHITDTGDLQQRLDPAGSDEIGRLTTTFNGMLTKLEGSIDAQRQLVADASHELRTPLTALRTNLDLLAEPPGLADPGAPGLIEQARRGAQDLAELVGDLVRLARYGQAPPVLQDVRLDLVVHRVCDRANERHDQRAMEVGTRPVVVIGDEDALERAVSNLIDNAITWTPPDGRIQVQLEAGALRVIDSGPGIAPEDLPRIFQRFYRSPEARSHNGSGLGLAIVKQVAEMHGGTVTATSTAAGSTFTLTLPTEPVEPNSETGNRPVEDTSEGGRAAGALSL